MRCKLCDGGCACHISPPCSYCERHGICEGCGSPTCADGDAEGYEACVCEACRERERDAAVTAGEARHDVG